MTATRNDFLRAVGSATLAAAIPSTASALDRVTTLTVTNSTIDVLGKTARVLDIVQPNGTRGIFTAVGRRFRVRLFNQLESATLIHWHGLTPPAHQDGVPIISQPALPPGQSYDYDFPLTFGGTFFMHSHQGFQEQRLLAAPLIIADPADAARDEQNVVVELSDFSFRSPEEIYAQLRAPGAKQPLAPGTRDANDVNYDAYLVNRRAIADAEIVRVEPRARVRLRFINGATATNFTIDLGSLTGTLIAVDGRAVRPLAVNRFGIGIAQRCDVVVETPAAGTYPIFAVREADRARGAIVLATRGSRVPVYAAAGEDTAPYNTLALERRLRAAAPLAVRVPDRRLAIDLTGDMAKYSWSIDKVVWTNALAASGKAPYLPVSRLVYLWPQARISVPGAWGCRPGVRTAPGEGQAARAARGRVVSGR